jgi:putative membrane protein
VRPDASTWAWDLDVLILVPALALAYALATRGRPVERWRLVSFGASLGLIAIVSLTPLQTIALNYLLSAHLLQNVALAEWAPALAVAAIPAGLAERIAAIRALRPLLHPLVALPLWLLAYGVWHLPALYDAALRHHSLLHLEHATYVATGFLLWWPVFKEAPARLSAGAKSAYLFAAFVLASPLGLLLALVPSPLYDFYEQAPRIWGLDPLADQQIAGVIMSVSEAVVFFAAFLVFFTRFMREEEADYSQGHAER